MDIFEEILVVLRILIVKPCSQVWEGPLLCVQILPAWRSQSIAKMQHWSSRMVCLGPPTCARWGLLCFVNVCLCFVMFVYALLCLFINQTVRRRRDKRQCEATG